MQIAEALKSLYKKVTGEEEAPTESQIAELINQLAENWPESSGGSSYTLPEATETTLGGVKKSAEVSSVSVSDATAAGEAYDQAIAQSVVALANANKTAINAIITNLKAAGIMT